MHEALSLAEGVCLCLVVNPPSEHPAHGWQLVRELSPNGPLGRIWSLSRPLTYRSLDSLEANGLIHRDRSDPNSRRHALTPTAAGHGAAERWLDEPVDHIRDLRTGFLIKYELRRRTGHELAGFAERQATQLAGAFTALDEPGANADDIVSLWRRHNALAAQRVLAVLADRTEYPAELR
jgi:DNA-binding MarR family transcriptional regulator